MRWFLASIVFTVLLTILTYFTVKSYAQYCAQDDVFRALYKSRTKYIDLKLANLKNNSPEIQQLQEEKRKIATQVKKSIQNCNANISTSGIFVTFEGHLVWQFYFRNMKRSLTMYAGCDIIDIPLK